MATAGIVVAIMTVHYFFIHRPDLDPFRCSNGTIEPRQHEIFRQNPVDAMILGSLRRSWRSMPLLSKYKTRWSHLEPPVTKVCIDLVLVHFHILIKRETSVYLL